MSRVLVTLPARLGHAGIGNWYVCERTIPDSRQQRHCNRFMSSRSLSTASVTVLTVGALTLVSGCAQRPAPAAPPRVATSVLIITIDTLRADRLGGEGRDHAGN